MKILAIDGNSIINRAFYGIRILTTKNGQYTNALVGFLNTLQKLCDAENPDGVVVAWDVHHPTFRHLKYAEYKAGRHKTPDELLQQIPVMKEIITALGYKNIERKGYEADDILGTVSKKCEANGDECVIATGDRDSLQLVSKSTKVLLSATKAGKPEITVYTPETIAEQYGVRPEGMLEIKALQGDSSDNIPGVAGIGQKTAGELISKFGSVDYIYENLDELEIKDSVKNKLRVGKDNAYLSKWLGTINREVPLDDISEYKSGALDRHSLADVLYKYELRKQAEHYGLSIADAAEESVVSSDNEFFVTDDAEKLQNGSVVDIMLHDEFAVAVNGSAVGKLSFDLFNALVSNKQIKKRVYDAKAVHKYCIKNRITAENIVFDSMLAAYLLNPSSSDYGIENLSDSYKVRVNIDEEPFKSAAENSVLCALLSGKIKENGLDGVLNDIELPLSRVLAEMETEGFLVDGDGLSEYGKKLETQIESLRKSVIDEAGFEFNLNSPKQLGIALFEKLGLPCKKKTKSGYSTAADVLEELRYDYPVVENVLQYRTLAKLKSTYCDGLSAARDSDGRIRSTFNQTETKTGRISSSEPNLQNIPVRRPEGRELRKFFKAKEGFVLCDADYSQIELRVLASVAGDETMINAFKNGEDIHLSTAARVFNMPLDMVTPLMRSRAKAVNFGIVYGIGAFSLAKDIGVPRKEADEYIKSYLATYPSIDRYMHRVIEEAKRDGYVSTVFGRRRYLPELSNSNRMVAAFGERVARNMPIQGTAADIIKIAMIKVSERLARELPSAKLIMQVHDELIIETPEESADKASKILKEEMENAVQTAVPMTVDVHCGKTWFDAKE